MKTFHIVIILMITYFFHFEVYAQKRDFNENQAKAYRERNRYGKLYNPKTIETIEGLSLIHI